MQADAVVLAYAGCSTCKKALSWLEKRGIRAQVRPIVDLPPTLSELKEWIPSSGIDVRKWLNTSGQSYRAIGKEKIDAATPSELTRWLSEDGKLVKRPVLVRPSAGSGQELCVLVGFKEEAWAAAFPQ